MILLKLNVFNIHNNIHLLCFALQSYENHIGDYRCPYHEYTDFWRLSYNIGSYFKLLLLIENRMRTKEIIVAKKNAYKKQ